MIGPLALALAASAAPIDWPARLRSDAAAFRTSVLASHPGPVDRRNPGFGKLLDRSMRQVETRATHTTGYPGYYWALSELTAAFDDGHLGIAPSDASAKAFPWAYRWPGFVTATREGRQIVVQAEGINAPLLSAELLRCDGTPADRLLAERVGRFMGRWMLPSRRERFSGTLLLPPDNPWLAPIRRCTFRQAGGKTVQVSLHWQPIAADRRTQLLAAAVGQRHTSPIALEMLGNGTAWIGMGSFESDPSRPAGRQLTALTASIAAEAPAIRSAPRVVFDLRGNNGGSSNWIANAAKSIWGERTAAEKSRDTSRVEWRVSPANIAQLRKYVGIFAPQRSTDPEPYAWAIRTLAGLEGAAARGEALWTEPAEAGAAPTGATYPVAARAFVLTDNGCGSACLDAVDLLTALGATQIGQQTSADTDYMEVRSETLADGTDIWVPMKVYRGRPRGSNVPATPRYPWTGDIGDTPAIRAWIAGL